MSTRQCVLDRLPVELVHILLTYFTTQDILHTFVNVSDYLNEVLCSYSKYSWQFQSIRRSDFDLIVDHLRPEQVVSLTLSDDKDTPGQSQIFLSHFHLEQFTKLRTLRLIEIENPWFDLILVNLPKLPRLSSLIVNQNSTHHYSQTIHLNVFSHFNRLELNINVNFTSLLWPNLRHLKIATCTIHQCNIILRYTPQLISFQACINAQWSNFQNNFPMNQLIRLNLTIQSKYNIRDFSIEDQIFHC